MNVKQAQQEVATDIGQMLCVLAGNLMMEDREAGYLLAQQLQPIMDYLKTKYLPDLPRNETVETIISQQRQEAKAELAQEIEGFLQMHLYARPDKPMATIKFDDWVKLRKLLIKYLKAEREADAAED